jgi:hypothetical protein
MTSDKMIEVIRAWQDGKPIEYRMADCRPKVWTETLVPTWDFNLFEYRVKPS